MIVKKSGLLVLALMVQTTGGFAAQTRGVRSESAKKKEKKVVVSPAEAYKLLSSVELLLEELHEQNEANKAPRPEGTQPCDPDYPTCEVGGGSVDLTEINQCLCLIKKQLSSVLVKTCSILDKTCSIQDKTCTILDKTCSTLDILGDCDDDSILLPSIVDKADIDNLCETVITLLKTILLELRGSFQGL